MSYAKRFVSQNNLQPADAILLRKKLFGMVNHFAVYLGNNNSGEPVFVANYTDGIQLLSKSKVDNFLRQLEPKRIDRFAGTERQRKNAVARAESRIGEKNYNLITNNCEHYKNFVQNNKKFSEQVANAGKAMMAAGGASALKGIVSDDDKATTLGLLALALGAFTVSSANQD